MACMKRVEKAEQNDVRYAVNWWNLFHCTRENVQFVFGFGQSKHVNKY